VSRIILAVNTGSLTDYRERQFKARIVQWGLTKNLTRVDARELVMRAIKVREGRVKQSGRDIAVKLRDRDIPLHRVERYIRRRGLLESSEQAPSSPQSFRLDTTLSPDQSVHTPVVEASNSTENADPDMDPTPSTSPFALTFTPASPVIPAGDAADLASAGSSTFSKSPVTVDISSQESYEEEGENRSKRRRLSTTNSTSLSEARTLACPFYKHNPGRYNPQNEDTSLAMRFRTCAGPGWKSVSRLRYVRFSVRVLRLLMTLGNISFALMLLQSNAETATRLSSSRVMLNAMLEYATGTSQWTRKLYWRYFPKNSRGI
jgi:hypothetical protein